VVQFWKLRDKLALARQLKKTAERDLWMAKEKRLAQVGRALRPVIWLVRVAMPRQARRLDQAVTRCTRLAYQQQIRRAGRAAIQKAYEQWRQEHIEKPIGHLKQQSSALARPAQEAERSRIATAQARIPLPDSKGAAAIFLRGYQALAGQPTEAKTIASLSAWLGKEDELVTLVLNQSKGNPTWLTKEQYAAAVRIGRVGNLLTVADSAPTIKVPSDLAPQRADIERLSSRLRSFGLRHPLTTSNLSAFSASAMRAHLTDARKAGLLDAGPTWTFKYSAARNLAQELAKEFERKRDRAQP
jgi:hypothetical protein